MKRIAVSQSNYIPWKGYFDLIDKVDEFVLLDDVQYTKGDWRNRNRIKTPHATRWLTVPVHIRGHRTMHIRDVTIADAAWHVRHLAILRQYYRIAPCYAEMADWLAALYDVAGLERLSHVNERMIRAVCDLLAIATRVTRSEVYAVPTERNDRLVEICRQAGAGEYVTGPKARQYLDESRFAAAGIRVTYFGFGDYHEYPQPYPPFEHNVSILDLILCTGRDARRYACRDPGSAVPAARTSGSDRGLP